MKKTTFLLLLFPLWLFSQHDPLSYCIAFYNVENLFHPEKDSVAQDEAFTPDGLYRWNYKRYFKKINGIAKTIIAIGEGSPPDVVGLAEIENSTVLQHLCYASPLKKYGYRYIHYDSPDRRGIDVAFLYRADRVSILHEEAIGIVFPFEPESGNRDILYCHIKLNHGDSLHLFVNHWTSRYGGLAATTPKRKHYAAVLRHKTDSLFRINPKANMIIMGDFNDYPTDESLYQVLEAKDPEGSVNTSRLCNLMLLFSPLENKGTHKHEDFWGCLDQIIVSGNILSEEHSLHIIHSKAEIFDTSFLLEPDEKYGGYKPFRTYLGPRYLGGYADHLPVFVRLRVQHRGPFPELQLE